MKTAIVTGSCGLIGSEVSEYFHDRGFRIIGIDNDGRSQYFGPEASTRYMVERLRGLKNYTHYDIDITRIGALDVLRGERVDVIIHTAAQPSHDWASSDPFTDFNVNAFGTLNMLEYLRHNRPEAVFVYTSTNKVYGDRPNYITDYVESATRWNPVDKDILLFGIDESMSIDNCKHSLFGVSKAYGDLIVQEYGRYYGFKTAVFRGGCLTGRNHTGVKAHGFLSYLVKCAQNGVKYYINGFKGKQVRDNIHSEDVAAAFYEFYKNPKSGAVYNLGGGMKSNCSILEAISIIEELSGLVVDYEVLDVERDGDHIWYVSDTRKFRMDYPGWVQNHDLRSIIRGML